MTIKNWPKSERPREKLLRYGAKSLSDAELLAICLRTGLKGKSALDLAYDLLQTFGNLRNIMTAPKDKLFSIKGIGSAKLLTLDAALEITRRHLEQKLQNHDILRNPKDTVHYLKSILRDYQEEVFACLFLDGQYRLIQFDILFWGTIDASQVHPRVVIKKSLYHNAAALIIAHNHPSGLANPSEADKHLTVLIQDALKMIDVRLLDHIIIADNEYYSFSECGIMP